MRNYYLQFEAQRGGMLPPGMMHPGMHPGMHPMMHPGMMPPGGMHPGYMQRPLDASQGMRPLGAPPPGALLLLLGRVRSLQV